MGAEPGGADEPLRTGPTNGLTDVSGLFVGHAQRDTHGWLTGVTAILARPGGMVTAVDVRGGGPATRETDALAPWNLVTHIEAICLSGGSAYGLQAAGGVVDWLEDQGRGFQVGLTAHEVVPVVPAAALFDLGRGGDFRARPDVAMGREAVAAASATAEHTPVAQGCVGAGLGAVAAGMKGGVGTASVVLPSGATVAALVVVNAAGSPVDPPTGTLYGVRSGLPGEFNYRAPGAEEHEAAVATLVRIAGEREAPTVNPLNTTLAVVATDAALTRTQTHKLAAISHDGLARAIRPVHTPFDGDTVFAASTGGVELFFGEAGGPFGAQREARGLTEVFVAGAEVLERAIVHAILSATSVTTRAGHYPSYRELYPGSVLDDAAGSWLT